MRPARLSSLLILLFLPIVVRAATRTWTGAVNSLWSEAGNWTGGRPVNGDDLLFNTVSTSTNDIASLSVNSIAVESLNVTASGEVRGIATNACGSAHASARIVVETPPRRRSAPHR